MNHFLLHLDYKFKTQLYGIYLYEEINFKIKNNNRITFNKFIDKLPLNMVYQIQGGKVI